MGPDGAIYIADWYNPIINHGEVDFRDPRRDKTHGRIWQFTAKGRPLVERPKLGRRELEQLLEDLKAPEDYTRRQARLACARWTRRGHRRARQVGADAAEWPTTSPASRRSGRIRPLNVPSPDLPATCCTPTTPASAPPRRGSSATGPPAGRRARRSSARASPTPTPACGLRPSAPWPASSPPPRWKPPCARSTSRWTIPRLRPLPDRQRSRNRLAAGLPVRPALRSTAT